MLNKKRWTETVATAVTTNNEQTNPNTHTVLLLLLMMLAVVMVLLFNCKRIDTVCKLVYACLHMFVIILQTKCKIWAQECFWRVWHSLQTIERVSDSVHRVNMCLCTRESAGKRLCCGKEMELLYCNAQSAQLIQRNYWMSFKTRIHNSLARTYTAGAGFGFCLILV